MNKNRAIDSTRKDATGELAGFFIALLFFGAAERPRHKRDCRHHRAPSWYGHLNPEFTIYQLFVSAISYLFALLCFASACSEGHSPFDPVRRGEAR
jgi:hypothetical protein